MAQLKDTVISGSLSVSDNVAVGNTYKQKILTGTGVVGGDRGEGVSPRYFPSVWTFNENVNLVDGTEIVIKIPIAGHDYGVYISLDNGTTYKPVTKDTTSRLTTHFGVGVILKLIYDSAGSAASMFAVAGQDNTTRITVTGGVWRVMNFYDSGNTNDTGTLVRDYGGNVAIANTLNALYRYQLLLPVIETNYGWKVVPANTTSNSTATTKTTIYTGDFNPFGDFFYYNSTTTISANGNIRADAVFRMYPMNASYSFNCGSTFTAGKDVYLVAYMTGQCTAKLRNPGATGTDAAATATGANAGPITQTLPATDDGYIYIRLGRAYNTNTFDLSMVHPIYKYENGGIKLYTGEMPYVTSTDNGKFLRVVNGKWTAETVPAANGSSF